MIKLLQGDDSTRTVEISLPEAAFAEGMTLEFSVGGLVRVYPAASSVTIDFPADWAARQPLGRMLARWTLVAPDGTRATIANAYPLYITNDAADTGIVNAVSPPVIPTVDFSDLEGLTDAATPGETKALLNEILKRLRTACIAFAIALTGLCTLAAAIATSPLDLVPGNEHVVTNVTFEGLATSSQVAAVEARAITAPAATNIARSVVNTVWDAKLGVAWEARMHDGALYYVAVTNRQEVAE